MPQHAAIQLFMLCSWLAALSSFICSLLTVLESFLSLCPLQSQLLYLSLLVTRPLHFPSALGAWNENELFFCFFFFLSLKACLFQEEKKTKPRWEEGGEDRSGSSSFVYYQQSLILLKWTRLLMLGSRLNELFSFVGGRDSP